MASISIVAIATLAVLQGTTAIASAESASVDGNREKPAKIQVKPTVAHPDVKCRFDFVSFDEQLKIHERAKQLKFEDRLPISLKDNKEIAAALAAWHEELVPATAALGQRIAGMDILLRRVGAELRNEIFGGINLNRPNKFNQYGHTVQYNYAVDLQRLLGWKIGAFVDGWIPIIVGKIARSSDGEKFETTNDVGFRFHLNTPNIIDPTLKHHLPDVKRCPTVPPFDAMKN